jgi:hypothetical protein
MIGFIDDNRAAYGVEPICRVLPIAPSTYHARVARRADPAKASSRARRESVYAPRSAASSRRTLGLWCAQGVATARPRGCFGRPLHCGTFDAPNGLAWRRSWQGNQDHDRWKGAMSRRSCEPAVPIRTAKSAVAGRLQCAAASGVRDGGEQVQTTVSGVGQKPGS